ncbi:MAG: O-antigen ligase family protein [Bdellovibrionales bacterium]|nr:O-antigen ligase family protein [Bdellovibrionales bacterium]
MAMYVVALSISIAGMEIFAGFLLIYALTHYAYQCANRRKEAKKGEWSCPQLSIGIDGYVFGFWGILVLGAIFIPDLQMPDRIYIIGEGRWIILLYVLVYIFRSHQFDFRTSSLFVLGLYLLVSLLSASEFFTGLVPLKNSTVDLLDIGGHFSAYRVSGYFGNSMTYAHNIGLWFSLFLSFVLFSRKILKINKVLLYVVFVVTSMALFLTFTRGVWLSVGVAVSIMLLVVYRKRAFYFIGSGAFIVLVLALTLPMIKSRLTHIMDESNQGRINLWKANVAMFLDHPFLGVGYRQNAKNTLKYYDKLNIDSDFASHAHNNYLQVLAGTGIFGLIFYLIFNGVLIYWAYRVYRENKDTDPITAAIGLGLFMAYIHLHIGGLSEANFQDGEISHSFVFLSALLIASKDRPVLINKNS